MSGETTKELQLGGPVEWFSTGRAHQYPNTGTQAASQTYGIQILGGGAKVHARLQAPLMILVHTRS